ncbi:MAG: ABC transporter permease, partial [Telluria sp.]
SMLAASVHIAMAMNAKSFKEAQSMASIVVLLPMIPGIVVSMMELKTAMWMYAVPMLSNQTLLREIAKGGEIGVQPFVLTFFSSLVPALAGIVFAAWRLRSERYVLAV